MSTPRRGGAGDGISSGDRTTTNETTTPSGSKSPRKARFRRRLSLSRPRVPRPKLRRAKLPSPQGPKVPRPQGDLWFRFVTGLRAIGYWLREKAQIVGRGLARAAGASAQWWSRRSRWGRMRILAIAGVVVLYLIVKLVSVPGVPCQVSAAKECAPSNDTIAFVPKDASLYAHLTVNGDSHQSELAEELGDELPNFVELLTSETRALASPSGKPIDIANGVLPWASEDLALVEIPLPKRTSSSAYIVGVGNDDQANQFLTSIAPPGTPKQGEQNGTPVSAYAGGFATARAGDELLFGNVIAVRAALGARSGEAPRLEDSDLDAARDRLPDVRLAEVYLSPAGIQRFLVGRGGTATQLDTFVDYGATTGMAASATIRDDGVQVEMVSELDPQLQQRSPTVFAELPEFSPDLADEAGTRALGYIGVGELGPALNNTLTTAGPGGQGLAGSLRALAQRLQQEAGIDPFRDLLPALSGQAALVAEPTESVPYASLIVEGVTEERARDALAMLQNPLLRSVSTAASRVQSFQSRDVDGVPVHTLQISPSINLSYGVFNGKLVISTQPEGIAQVRDSGDGLAGTKAYEQATEPLPDRVSALVFLNLDEVFGLRPLQQGLAVDPLYASLSEDISHIESLGLAVRGSDDELRTELFLAVND